MVIAVEVFLSGGAVRSFGISAGDDRVEVGAMVGEVARCERR